MEAFLYFFFRFIFWKKYETAPSHSFCVRSFKQRAVYFLPHQSVYGLIFLLHQSAGYFQIVTEILNCSLNLNGIYF